MRMWRRTPARRVPNAWGYGRNPAFWFTKNMAFNWLFELHRFTKATHLLRQLPRDDASDADMHEDDADWNVQGKDPDAVHSRCLWALNNPDILSTIHMLRAELDVEYLLRHIVPCDD